MNEIELLTEGGAAGHLAHPFEDADLTFGDMKEMINRGLVGGLDKEAPVTEKLDGQNIAFSVRDGKIVFARNKGHVRNRGENALDRDGIGKQFAGRGGIEKAFTGAAEDLEAAVQKLGPKEVKRMFGNGSKFMSLEVILPDTQNVIPYGKSVLVMHGTITYDKDGNETGRNAQDGRDFGEAVKKVGADRQKTFGIEGAQSIVFSSADEKENKKKADEYNKELDKAAKEFGLNDKSKLSDYRKKWWEKELNKEEKKSGVKFTKSERAGIVKRWSDGDKTFGVKDLQDEKKKTWFRKYETDSLEKSQKSMIRPIESTFLKAGAQTLKRVTNFVSSNNPETTKQVKKDISTAIKAIQSSNDPAKLAKLEKELERLKDIGIDNVVPSEGLVFMYKGKPYKFTGAFAPINQINGTFKFDKPKEEKPETKPKEKYEKPNEKEEKKKAEKQPKRTVAIFAGRFQPFHAGHHSVYKSLVDKFGKDNVYIASSNVTDPVRSPFGFSDKQNIISTMFDVPADKVVQVKNPYRPVEVLEKTGKDTTYVTAVSQKDAERLDQGGKYFKNYDKTDKGTHKRYEDEGYYIVAPEMKLQVNGGNISGTQLRATFGNEFLSDSEKKDIFIQVYGKFNKKIYDKIVGKTTKAERAKVEQEKAKVEKDKKSKQKTDKTDKKGGKETGNKKETKLDKKTRKKLKSVLSTTVVNPKTGNEILVRSALKYPKGSKVRKAAEDEIQNALSSTNESFPGGIGVGLVLPGGYINGAPNQKNVNKMKKRIRQQKLAKEVIEEANTLLKSVNTKNNRIMESFEKDSIETYNPIVRNYLLNENSNFMPYILQLIQEEIEQFSKNNSLNEEDEKDPDVTYTDTDGQSKTIKYSSAIKYDKEHPAYKAAQALKPKADTAAAEEPTGEKKPGEEKPGEKKTGEEKPKPGAAAPQPKPQGQSLGGSDLLSAAEKEKQDGEKKSGEETPFSGEKWDKLSPEEKKDAQAAAKVQKEMQDMDDEHKHAVHSLMDNAGPVRKGIAKIAGGIANGIGQILTMGQGGAGTGIIADKIGKFIATVDKRLVRGVKHFVHHQAEMWGGFGKALKSLGTSGRVGTTTVKSKNPDTGEEEDIKINRKDFQKQVVLRNPDGSPQRTLGIFKKKVWVDKEPPVEPSQDDPDYDKKLEKYKKEKRGYDAYHSPEKDADGKTNKQKANEAHEQQKKGLIGVAKFTAVLGASLVGGHVLGAAATAGKAAAATGQGLSGIASSAVQAGTEAVHHILHSTASELGKAIIVDLGKHSALEVLGLSGEAAGAAGAGLSGVLGLVAEMYSKSSSINEENEQKQDSNINMVMLGTILQKTLEKMKDYKISNQQMLNTIKKYKAKQKTDTLSGLVKLDSMKDSKNINESVSYSRVKLIKEFTEWASNRLKLENKPQIKIVSNESFASNGQPSLGAFSPQTNEIYVVMENRLIADVLRTIAHEMVHQKQMEMGLMTGTNEDGRTGSAIENKANAVAGILLREYGKLKKEIYTESVKKKSTDEDINVPLEKGDTVLMGKFKNKKVVVKDIGNDDHGMPTINGKQATTFRKMENETIKKIDDKYVVYPKKGGKRLGTHDSLTGAKKQLAAIEINKESINETSGLGTQGTDSRPSGTFLPKGAARKLNSNDGVNKSDNWYVNGGYTQMYFPVADDIFGDDIVSSRNTVRYSDDNTKNSTAPKTEFNNKKHNSKLDIHEDIDPYEIYGKSIMDNLKS